MMMESEFDFDQSSWFTFYNVMDTSFDQDVGYYDVSSLIATPEDISEISSIENLIPSLPTIFLDGFDQSPGSDVDDQQFMLPLDDYLLDEVEGDHVSNSDEKSFLPSQDLSNEGGHVWSPSPSVKSSEASMVATPIPLSSSLILPGEAGSEIENQLTVFHLLKAYGEAMERGQKELADVTMKCVSEKGSPAGENLERLAFCLSQDVKKQQAEFLRQESCKNYEEAFGTFYQIFPFGKFAHFTANSAILEAIPADAETVHIIDFDMGEGIQWPPMIEALAKQHKGVKLTSIKWEKESCNWAPSMWSFEEAKRRLVDYARCLGLKLKMEEMGMDEIVSEVKRAKKRGGRKEFLAFNCTLGLGHMGRVRSKNLVKEFLRVAKELLSANSISKGIITFADGENQMNEEFSCFGSFFDANMVHYLALLESIESNFPTHLRDARMALECLFVAPYISCNVWIQKWRETREGLNVDGLEGWRMSGEMLEEAREMVKNKQNWYGVRIAGQRQNEMILEWKGNPLVRVSAWRS